MMSQCVFITPKGNIFQITSAQLCAATNIPTTLSLISKEIYALSEHKCVLGPNSIYLVISINMGPGRLKRDSSW